MLGFNYRKSVQLLNVLAKKEQRALNKMKALKLIWLCDRLHLRLYGRPIINDTYFALNYGPVASHTKDLIENTSFLSEEEKAYRNQFIHTDTDDNYSFRVKNEIDLSVFSKSDLDVIDKVYDNFGKLDQFTLSEVSHHYPEWKKFESHLKSKTSSRFEMNYDDFFENPNHKNDGLFANEVEILASSKEIFHENGYIYRLI